MIKKDLVCFLETNEADEFIKINRLETDTGFFLLTLGANRMVINGAELVEAISAIDFYSTMFDEERKRKEQASKPKVVSIVPDRPVGSVKGKKVTNKEDEGAIVLDPTLRTGPTESELALERQTKHMQGETLVVTENKE